MSLNNPMLRQLNSQQQLNGLSTNLNNIKQLYNLIKTAGNPQMLLNEMMKSNPQLKEVMQYVNLNGGDPKTAFYQLAKQRGINPDDIIKMLQQ